MHNIWWYRYISLATILNFSLYTQTHSLLAIPRPAFFRTRRCQSNHIASPLFIANESWWRTKFLSLYQAQVSVWHAWQVVCWLERSFPWIFQLDGTVARIWITVLAACRFYQGLYWLICSTGKDRSLLKLGVSFFFFGLINNGMWAFLFVSSNAFSSSYSTLRHHIIRGAGPCPPLNTQGHHCIL